MKTQEDTKKLLREALVAIQKLKAKTKNSKGTEPIAIVGMSCRFPGGVQSPEDYWNLLIEGKEGIRKIPSDRWDHEAYFDADPSKENKMYIQEGGFLKENIKGFDASLFGISPREAIEMDPQHRMLLELSWEALENASIDPLSLKGSHGGVFVGIISSEYAMIDREAKDISPYTLTGLTPHMASGRLSHFYGLHGPSLSIDTACSSSLVCLHQACKSLAENECDLALVGGVNLMVSPEAMVSLCKVRALSPDGRCKPFDENGKGYGRGEGGAMLILKRLSRALQDRDQILSVVKGTAINHDGPSSGLTVPNMHAQTDVISSALDVASLDPEDVTLIEAHGTGTNLGDPIEIQALESVYGGVKRKTPLLLGTCKANIGHLEAAAGVAGVIKAVLSIQNKTIPPHINFQKLNPRINLDKIPAVLPREKTAWTDKKNPLSAAVSSFGFSGTNAHVILQEWKPEQIKEEKTETLFKKKGLFLSAQSKESLDLMVKKYQEYLKNVDAPLDAIAGNILLSRTQCKHRLVVYGETKEKWIEALDAYLSKNAHYSKSVQSLKTLITLDDEPVEQDAISHPVFEKHYKRCAALFQNENAKTQTFCSQFALVQFLNFLGLPLHSFTGKGSAFFLSLVLTQAITLEQGARLLEGKEKGKISLSRPKFRLLDWNTKEPVQFGASVEVSKLIALSRKGDVPFGEIKEDCLVLKPADFKASFSDALLTLCSRGVTVNWRAYLKKNAFRKLSLPTYSFAHKEYWVEKGQLTQVQEAAPLVGMQVQSPLSSYQHRFVITKENLREMEDTHRILHVGYLLKMILSAGSKSLKIPQNQIGIGSLSFEKAFYVSHLPFEIFATVEKNHLKFFTKEGHEWKQNLFCQFNPIENALQKAPKLPEAKPLFTKETFYAHLEKRGISLGKSVQWVESVWRTKGQIVAKLSHEENLAQNLGLFDAIAQLFHLALPIEESKTKLMVIKWEEAMLLSNPENGPFSCVITFDEKDPLIGSVSLYDSGGSLIFFCKNFQMKRLNSVSLRLQEIDTTKGQEGLVEKDAEKLITFLKITIGKLLSSDVEDLADEDTLYELGFDSIVGMDFRNFLESSLQVTLDIELLFQNPSIKEVANYLLGKSEKTQVNHWLRGDTKNQSLTRLYCFPYGAGGASEYHSWIESLSAKMNVMPIQLPGREDRISEAPIANIDELAKELYEQIKNDLDIPYFFYGHSMGALIAFRLALEIRRRKKKMPRHLFVGAYSSPTILPNPWLVKAKDQFNEEKILTNIPTDYAEVSKMENEYLDKLIPTILADLKIVESFNTKKIKPLDLPITAFWGRDDDRVTEEETKQWQKLTTKKFHHYVLDGDHFFLKKDQNKNELMKVIENTLETDKREQ